MKKFRVTIFNHLAGTTFWFVVEANSEITAQDIVDSVVDYRKCSIRAVEEYKE